VPELVGINPSPADDYTCVGTESVTTTTPHDALFKASFETPEHAAALFRQVLPATVVAAIDWSTISREAPSFIDPTLAARHGDLLFCVRLLAAPDLQLFIYLMLEHQSRSHHDMCLRGLGYQVRNWERYRKQHKTGPLPVIIPVVISHDPDGWTAPTSFHDLFDLGPLGPLDSLPELARFVPDFLLRVEDLITVDDEQLKRWQLATFAQLTLQLLRDTRDPTRFRQHFPEWIELFREILDSPNGVHEIEQLYRYIWHVAGQLRFEEFRATIQSRLPQTKEIAMTIAEQLRAEGRAEGEAKGRAEGRVRTLMRQMTLKFGPLSPEHAALIEHATEQQLDAYLDRILTASTIEAVLGLG
jgi:predicted transposase/invertase (TIGR01784 family)